MNKDSQILSITEAARQEGYFISADSAEYIWRKYSQNRGLEWVDMGLWRAGQAEEIWAAIKEYIE